MQVAAFQFDVRRGEVERNLAAVEAGLRRAAKEGVQLVVLPEMWATSFVQGRDTGEAELARFTAAAEQAVERVGQLSGELGLVVAGSALASAGEGRLPYNRLHVFERGRLLTTYDKVHLFSPTAETEGFSAGERPPETVVVANGVRLAGVVCYDLRFGPLLAIPFANGVDVLVAPAQWPAPRATHWRALVLGRAVENQCFVVAANRVGTELVGRRELELAFPGNSLVVDPAGRVLAEGEGEAGLVTAAIEPADARRMRVRVPVAKDRRPDLYEGWGADPPRTP